MRKSVNFANVIELDNIGKFDHVKLGGRYTLINAHPPRRSTIHNVNCCAACNRNRTDDSYYCYNHAKKIKKKLVAEALKYNALYMRSVISREHIEDKIARVRAMAKQDIGINPI